MSKISKESMERYEKTEYRNKHIMGEQILDHVETLVHNLLDEWLDDFRDLPDSNVYKEIYKLRFEKKLF
ncbi:hypothetical protein D3C87_81970 [compost metagenome]